MIYHISQLKQTSYRACLQVGVEPRFREWDGRGSLTAFVISLNVHRRHMDKSQLACVAVRALPLFEDEAKETEGTWRYCSG